MNSNLLACYFTMALVYSIFVSMFVMNELKNYWTDFDGYFNFSNKSLLSVNMRKPAKL